MVLDKKVLLGLVDKFTTVRNTSVSTKARRQKSAIFYETLVRQLSNLLWPVSDSPETQIGGRLNDPTIRNLETQKLKLKHISNNKRQTSFTNA